MNARHLVSQDKLRVETRILIERWWELEELALPFAVFYHGISKVAVLAGGVSRLARDGAAREWKQVAFVLVLHGC